ncbi:MAG: hypothetical protein PGMFKBFP_02857 [Anaerolineales bacterium]|jgi:hypothetical protein|nr:hypothetical protein [Anaerolineales bacterium]
MQTVQKTATWFSKQGLFGKVAIGCSGLFMLCCLCSIPIAVLSPSTPTPKATGVSSVQTPAIETAMAEISQTATMNAPTNTPVPILPTETPLPTETATPTAILSPEEALLQLSKDRFKDDLIEAKLSDVFGKKYATVDYDLGLQWSESTAISGANMQFIMFAPKVFEIEGIDVLELRFFTTFTDVYGNDKQEVALKYTITRELSGKINWSGIVWRKVGIILNLEGDGSGVYVHPALESAWLEYISGE